jgi:predicted small lipoprotein YifL
MSAPVEHRLKLETRGSAQVWAICSCGWKGPLRSTVARATEDFADHAHEATRANHPEVVIVDGRDGLAQL